MNYVNQFEFVKELKAGGFGKVFIAWDALDNKLVAIKKIETVNLSSDEIRNIYKEAMYLESLKHKNIIKSLVCYLHNNTFYTAMEYAKGGELDAYIKQQKLFSEAESKKLFKQMHDAVKYIHSRNIIHRDLNPVNLLFSDEGKENLVLIDFGISGVSKGNIKEKIYAGTIKFIPPEVASCSNTASSTKIDNWALGIILFLMVYGCYPFDGKDDNEILYKITKENYNFPNNIEISKTCKKIISQLLDKNPNTRLELNAQIFEDWYNEE